jgi:hypothetical protein
MVVTDTTQTIAQRDTAKLRIYNPSKTSVSGQGEPNTLQPGKKIGAELESLRFRSQISKILAKVPTRIS